MRPALAALALAAILSAAACSEGGDGSDSSSAAPSGAVQFAINDSALVAGPNQFLLAMTGPGGEWITGAQLHFKFYFIDPRANNRKTYKVELDAEEAALTEPVTLTRRDGASVDFAAGDGGVYQAPVAFDSTGVWIVEVTGEAGGARIGPAEAEFEVSG